MKSLAQICYDAAWPEDAPAAWQRESQFSKNRWEAAAQAVRQAVLEEAAKELEGLAADAGNVRLAIYDAKSDALTDAAAEIRNLKEKQ